MLRRAANAAQSNPHLPITAYLALIGCIALAEGGLVPREIEVTLPALLVHVWTYALGLGGLLATGGCLLERTRAESAGHVLLIFGIGTYAAAVAWVASVPFGQWLAVLALVGVSAIRMRVLTKARRAQRKAAIILYGDDGEGAL